MVWDAGYQHVEEPGAFLSTRMTCGEEPVRALWEAIQPSRAVFWVGASSANLQPQHTGSFPGFCCGSNALEIFPELKLEHQL